jgi:hypothetical protein
MSTPPMVDLPAAFYVLVGIAIVLLVWSLLRPRKDHDQPELPRRRKPITTADRVVRRDRLDAVLAQLIASPMYVRDRLGPHETELSHLLELALELDDVEGDHAQPHP